MTEKSHTNYKITFTVPGKPVGKQRHREGRLIESKKGHVFRQKITPRQTEVYERDVQTLCRAAMRSKPALRGPVKLIIIAVFQPPKSVSKSRKTAMLLGQEKPAVKPDFDNISKIISDALNNVAYYDDAQVCEHVIRKTYGEEAAVHVIVEPIDGDALLKGGYHDNQS